MNRNPKNDSEHVARFTRHNPPASEEEALAKLDSLDTAAGQIEAQLEHQSLDSLEVGEEYEGWRRRAISALGFNKAERRFLRGWLRQRQDAHEKEDRREERRRKGVYEATAREEEKRKAAAKLSSLSGVANQIRARAQELAEEVGRGYAPTYTTESLPKDIAAADERMAQLGAFKFRLQGAFSEVTAAWTGHPLSRAMLPGVKSPLTNILSKVELELTVLRGYIRQTRPCDPGSNWKTVCVGALARAVAGGFKLTPGEQLVFDQLRVMLGFPLDR